MAHIRRFRELSLGLGLLVGALLGAVLGAPGAVTAAELQPLVNGWEHHFSVTWDTTQRRGRVGVDGYVINKSPYRVGRVRVLVDSLDDAGRIVDQKISWVPGELSGDSRLYFDVSVTPAAQYRVRVFSYDRIEEARVMSP